MLKQLRVPLGVTVWLAGVVGFYLQLRASSLSEWLQSVILVGWVAVGLVIFSFLIGRELGVSRSKHLDGENTSLGIIRSFRRRDLDRIKPINQRIQKATTDIFFIGLSLPKLDNSTGLLEKKAREGVRVRLLVPDPCEKWLVLAIARFLMREGPYPLELSWFFNNFLPIWQKVPTHLEVRVHNQLPTVTGSIFDSKEGNIEIYMFGWKTDERFIFELDYDSAAIDCRANLEKLWRSATLLTSEDDFQKRISAANEIVYKHAGNHQDEPA